MHTLVALHSANKATVGNKIQCCRNSHCYVIECAYRNLIFLVNPFSLFIQKQRTVHLHTVNLSLEPSCPLLRHIQTLLAIFNRKFANCGKNILSLIVFCLFIHCTSSYMQIPLAWLWEKFGWVSIDKNQL